LKSQTVRTLKPSLLTTAIINSTPNHLTEYNYYLADTRH
jgi:hypothetical protein